MLVHPVVIFADCGPFLLIHDAPIPYDALPGTSSRLLIFVPCTHIPLLSGSRTLCIVIFPVPTVSLPADAVSVKLAESIIASEGIANV